MGRYQARQAWHGAPCNMGRSSVDCISLIFIFSKVYYAVWPPCRVRSTRPLIQLCQLFLTKLQYNNLSETFD